MDSWFADTWCCMDDGIAPSTEFFESIGTSVELSTRSIEPRLAIFVVCIIDCAHYAHNALPCRQIELLIKSTGERQITSHYITLH